MALFRQLFFYGLGGGLSVLSNMGMYWLLLLASVPYLVAGALSFLFGMITSFLMHKYVTFRSAGGAGREFGRYAFVTFLNLLANLGILYVLVDLLGANELSGGLIATALIAVWSYFIYKHFAFRHAPAA